MSDAAIVACYSPVVLFVVVSCLAMARDLVAQAVKS